MTTLDATTVSSVPDDVARQVILPEGHRDETALYEAYAWLRENSPLAQAHVEGYDPFWLVSKHADIMAVERDPELFTSGGGDKPGTHYPGLETRAGEEFIKSLTGGSLRALDSLTPLDPPEHTMIKDIANDWFRPTNLKKWEQVVRDLSREAIAARLHEGVNELDFVKEFAVFYPLHVIMSLVGIPASDEPRMMALTQEFFGPADPDVQRPDTEPLSPEAAARRFIATMQDFIGYFDGLVEDRRANPRDDLATVISVARDAEGEYYDKKYAYGWFIAIATAGHDTTASTLAGTLEALARHPDQLAAVQEDPSKIPDLVNEGLRWVSPVKQFVRQATRDTVLGGRQIRRGDRLVLLYPSANRDADIFEAPDEFRFDRRPNRHIAFGYGPHMCIGQHLAKLELRVMLEELLPRITGLETAGERRCVQSNFVGGLKNLPLRLQLR